jgi:hypothetical protein
MERFDILHLLNLSGQDDRRESNLFVNDELESLIEKRRAALAAHASSRLLTLISWLRRPAATAAVRRGAASAALTPGLTPR